MVWGGDSLAQRPTVLRSPSTIQLTDRPPSIAFSFSLSYLASGFLLHYKESWQLRPRRLRKKLIVLVLYASVEQKIYAEKYMAWYTRKCSNGVANAKLKATRVRRCVCAVYYKFPSLINCCFFPLSVREFVSFMEE